MQVWSTHKWCCKQDEAGRKAFGFPPLTTSEADMFDDSRGRVLSARWINATEGSCDWLICVDQVGWYQSDKNAKGMRMRFFSIPCVQLLRRPRLFPELTVRRMDELANQVTEQADLLRDLQKPKADSVAEPERSYILSLLNVVFYTFQAAHDTSTDLNELSAGPFHMAGLDICTIIRHTYQNDCLNPNFFSFYNEFFQEILLFHTVGLTNKVPNEIRGTFTKKSSARLTQLADHMPYDDPKLKEAFVSCAARCQHTATGVYDYVDELQTLVAFQTSSSSLPFFQRKFFVTRISGR